MSDAIFKLRVQGQSGARFFWDFDHLVPVLAELFADGSQQVMITVIEGDEGGDELRAVLDAETPV